MNLRKEIKKEFRYEKEFWAQNIDRIEFLLKAHIKRAVVDDIKGEIEVVEGMRKREIRRVREKSYMRGFKDGRTMEKRLDAKYKKLAKMSGSEKL